MVQIQFYRGVAGLVKPLPVDAPRLDGIIFPGGYRRIRARVPGIALHP